MMNNDNVLAERRKHVEEHHSGDSVQHVHVTTNAVAAFEMTPGHSARVETPIYRASHKLLVETLDQHCIVCGVSNSTLKDPVANKFNAQAMETHHFPIERSLLEACDPLKVHETFPEVIDQDTLEAFVDTPANLLVLCLAGDSPVLMSDGSCKPIIDIEVGDRVISHDLQSHEVTAFVCRKVKEDLVEIQGVCMTANHPVLTKSGWTEAGSVSIGESIYMVKMMQPHMLRVIADKLKILNPIMSLNLVSMVNPLFRCKSSTEMDLHDIAMFKHSNPLSISPDPSTHVALGSHPDSTKSFSVRARLHIQGGHAAFVRAIFAALSYGICKFHFVTANIADKSRLTSLVGLFVSRGTSPRASGVSILEKIRHTKRFIANAANFFRHLNVPTFEGRWDTVNHIKKIPFDGYVYDISVSHSHSFVANGLTVHNCDVHHRSMEQGIHHLLAQDFAVLPFLFDGYQIAASSKECSTIVGKNESIQKAHHATSETNTEAK